MISRTPGLTPPTLPDIAGRALERREAATLRDDPAVGAHATAEAPAAGEATGSGAPDGVDPALWSVLTTEEKQFFARSSGLGPLTYGRRAPDSGDRGGAIPPGGRIDIRV